jgi:demethylmenaquinone methyltransferase/2-methoxy-6-polyprenyl-1,4-benzoquinol methylase
MLRIARERAPAATFLQGDALALPFADESFERVLTAHFYGHLGEADRLAFLAEARRVADELVVVDSALREEVTPVEVQERILNDGSRWDIYKRYFTPDELSAELAAARSSSPDVGS